MLTTKSKIAVARALNRAIVGARGLAGLGPACTVSRGGVTWQLDLDEGIDLAIYLGRYQKVPARVLDEWIAPGSLVLDIGANIGAFTLPLLGRIGEAGRLVAFEPTDYAFAKLMRNIALNPQLAGRLIALQAALTDGTGTANAGGSFYSRWPLSGAEEGLHAEHLGAPEAASGARFAPLDTFVDELREACRIGPKVHFVKLDVDGHELSVLRGGRRVFAGERPAVLIEIAPHVQDEVEGRFEAVLQTLREYGYRMEDAVSGRALAMEADALRKAIPHGACIDALARPA